jgi:hypothetical protein
MRLSRLRWAIGLLSAAVLAVALSGFDRLGADCGDAIQSDGSETFECNTMAYMVMAAALIALAGLAGALTWAGIDWLLARREGRPR